jgi:hypothetical protein
MPSLALAGLTRPPRSSDATPQVCPGRLMQNSNTKLILRFWCRTRHLIGSPIEVGNRRPAGTQNVSAASAKKTGGRGARKPITTSPEISNPCPPITSSPTNRDAAGEYELYPAAFSPDLSRGAGEGNREAHPTSPGALFAEFDRPNSGAHAAATGAPMAFPGDPPDQVREEPMNPENARLAPIEFMGRFRGRRPGMPTQGASS